ncbi:hypothetical protein PT974_09691 [Cladobotryum mycophilum]|uniref:Uncharacterized protein n=1 Tax=Cladobotryum mycophilum TaxID=491253 RepID=A0ABR0SI30_9HYPO
MMQDKFTLVLHCTVNDALSLAQNNIPAFWANIWWRSWWPGAAHAVHPAQRAGRSAAPEGGRGGHGEGRGVCQVDSAGGRADSWLEAQVPDVSEGEKEGYKKVFEGVAFTPREEMFALDVPVEKLKEEVGPKRPYIRMLISFPLSLYPYNIPLLEAAFWLVNEELEYIGGIASILLKSGEEKADELILDILDIAMGTTTQTLFLKRGYEQVGELVQSLEPWGYEGEIHDAYIMVRYSPVSQS